MSRARRRRRLLLAGGILWLALSPKARRAGVGLRARAARLARGAGDPVTPFRVAPCYEHDRAEARAAGPARSEAAP